MPNTINIPTPLRPFTDKKEAVEVSGATVGELHRDLTTRYEGLRKHLYADNGKLRNFVNVYLNDEDIRYLQREATPRQSGRHAEHRARRSPVARPTDGGAARN
jgi:molybdopterin converting factor small subunit